MARPHLSEVRLGCDQVATNIALGVCTPELVAQKLFPKVNVSRYGGQLVEFDDSQYEDVDDNRADGDPYPEVFEGFRGRSFNLKEKGLRRKLGRRQYEEQMEMGIDPGERMAMLLMKRALLKHEVECTARATDYNAYDPNNRETLVAGAQFNDQDFEPGFLFTRAKTRVSEQIGCDPNVALISRGGFDALAFNPHVREHLKYTSRESLTPEILADLYGLGRVYVSNVIRKVGGVRTRAWGNYMVLAHVNPRALDTDLNFVTDGSINREDPSYGYTYVKSGHPAVSEEGFNVENQYYYRLMDFDRTVEHTGTDAATGLITHGYIVQDIIA